MCRMTTNKQKEKDYEKSLFPSVCSDAMIRRQARRWKINESKRNVGSIKCKPNICKLNVNIMNDMSAMQSYCYEIFHAHSLGMSDLTATKRESLAKSGGVRDTTFELIHSKLILSFNNLKADKFMVQMR